MTHSAAARFRIGDLEELKGDMTANYIGNGEVLDVIDTPHPGSANIEMDNNDIPLPTKIIPRFLRLLNCRNSAVPIRKNFC